MDWEKFVFDFGSIMDKSRATKNSQVREVGFMDGEKFFKGGKEGLNYLVQSRLYKCYRSGVAKK